MYAHMICRGYLDKKARYLIKSQVLTKGLYILHALLRCYNICIIDLEHG